MYIKQNDRVRYLIIIMNSLKNDSFVIPKDSIPQEDSSVIKRTALKSHTRAYSVSCTIFVAQRRIFNEIAYLAAASKYPFWVGCGHTSQSDLPTTILVRLNAAEPSCYYDKDTLSLPAPYAIDSCSVNFLLHLLDTFSTPEAESSSYELPAKAARPKPPPPKFKTRQPPCIAPTSIRFSVYGCHFILQIPPPRPAV